MRKEIKYKLSLVEASWLENILDKVLKIDENSNLNGDYNVKTIYFENYLRETTLDKKRNINNLSKYRIRMYENNPNSIFLERKTNCSGIIKKDSEKVTKGFVEDVMKGNLYNILDKNSLLKTTFYLQMILKQYRSYILIEYMRKAYIEEKSNVRITLDRNIKSTMDYNSFFDNSFNEYKSCFIILEIKYDKYIPDFVKDLLKGLDKNQISNSKLKNELEKFNI